MPFLLLASQKIKIAYSDLGNKLAVVLKWLFVHHPQSLWCMLLQCPGHFTPRTVLIPLWFNIVEGYMYGACSDILAFTTCIHPLSCCVRDLVGKIYNITMVYVLWIYTTTKMEPEIIHSGKKPELTSCLVSQTWYSSALGWEICCLPEKCYC